MPKGADKKRALQVEKTEQLRLSRGRDIRAVRSPTTNSLVLFGAVIAEHSRCATTLRFY